MELLERFSNELETSGQISEGVFNKNPRNFCKICRRKSQRRFRKNSCRNCRKTLRRTPNEALGENPNGTPRGIVKETTGEIFKETTERNMKGTLKGLLPQFLMKHQKEFPVEHPGRFSKKLLRVSPMKILQILRRKS